MSTYLVTGASGGIGVEVCRCLAGSGHRLVLAARDMQRIEDLRAKLPDVGADHIALPLDMASDASVSAFGAKLADTDVMLEGAVMMPPQPHADTDCMPAPDVWRDLFQTSFIGPLSTLKIAIERMHPDVASGKRCKIVIISGISSAQVMSNYATSNVLRTAWIGQAKTMAFVLGPRGIHVNTLSLGGTLTPWYRDGLARRAEAAGVTFDTKLAQEVDNVPLRKYGTPAEVAVAVEGLLSSFSDHMTGTNTLFEGGFTRAY